MVVRKLPIYPTGYIYPAENLYFTFSTSILKPAASLTAMSAKTFLFKVIPDFLRAFMNLLYERPLILAAALIRVIQIFQIGRAHV